uniref:Uncharacterized protein n=1 Tax=Megaselia scalaris TaxID=36166 RepID=T1GWT4_MEGSC
MPTTIPDRQQWCTNQVLRDGELEGEATAPVAKLECWALTCKDEMMLLGCRSVPIRRVDKTAKDRDGLI